MRRVFRLGLVAAAVILLAIQLIPVDRTNPPVTADIGAPVEIQSILERSCYDCHSNRTTWPWYSAVAPVSWLVVSDVDEARHKLNFSTWGELRPKERARARHEIVEETSEGEMPLRSYLWMHRSARLTAEDVATLKAWAEMGTEHPEGERP